jgi:hypothetical protein
VPKPWKKGIDIGALVPTSVKAARSILVLAMVCVVVAIQLL